MKATGMVRKVDELGRIVIPAETRCGEADGLTQHRGKNVCALCICQLRAALQGDAPAAASFFCTDNANI